MTMNFAGQALLSLSDVDEALAQTKTMHALLDELGSCIGSMRTVLAKREQALQGL